MPRKRKVRKRPGQKPPDLARNVDILAPEGSLVLPEDAAASLRRREWPKADRLYRFHLQASMLAIAAMVVTLGVGRAKSSAPVDIVVKWVCAPLLLLGSASNLVPNGFTWRPFGIRKSGDIPSYIRHLKRRLLIDSLVLSLSLAMLLHLAGFGSWIIRWLPVVQQPWQRLLETLATLASWILSGIIGNASYAFLRKKLDARRDA